jgi:hypothetical protein
MHSESITASTCLWLGFKDAVRKGYTCHLHCRQLTIDEVNRSTSDDAFCHQNLV